jgi:hypothetical protein
VGLTCKNTPPQPPSKWTSWRSENWIFQLWTIHELCNKLWEAEMGGQETLLVAQKGSGDTVCYLCKDQMICILSLKGVGRWFHFLSHRWLLWNLFESYLTLSRRRWWMLHHLTFEALLFWASIWQKCCWWYIMTASTPHFLHNYVRYIKIMFEGAFFMSSEAILSEETNRILGGWKTASKECSGDSQIVKRKPLLRLPSSSLKRQNGDPERAQRRR